MDIREIFELQDRAVPQNLQLFEDEFRWCRRALELTLDSHEFFRRNPEVVAYRTLLRESDGKAFVQVNVVVNLAYDAMGSLISALRLLEYGVLADTWLLMRGAFECTCYADYFARNCDGVAEFADIGERMKTDFSVNIAAELRKQGLGFDTVRQFLEKIYGQDMKQFYGRLCMYGAHASPWRPGFRIGKNEPEVRAYLSIGHRNLALCLGDYAATAKYTMGILFETWPDLMRKNETLVIRHNAFEEEYKAVFTKAQA